MRNNMIIIFDLDRTIFDTEKFKKDAAKVLNIDIKQYNKDCKRCFTDKERVYNLYELLRILKSEKRISSIKNYKEKIDGLLKNAKKSVYIATSANGLIRKHEVLKDTLSTLNKKGVKVRIAAPVNERTAAVVKDLQNYATVKSYHLMIKE